MGTLISGADITLTLKRDLTAGEPYPLRSGATGVPPPLQVTVAAPEGIDFGGAPNVIIFDQFIGSHGDAAFRAPDVGSWTSVSSFGGAPKLYSELGRTWLAGRDIDNINSSSFNFTGLYKNLGSITKFRLSHRAWVPAAYKFPAAANPGEAPAASSWKMTWLSKAGGSDLNGTAAPSRNVCIPSHVGNGAIAIAGNSNEPKYFDVTPKLFYADFSFTAPTFYSWYQSGAGTYDVYDQTGEIISVNDELSIVRRENTDPFHGLDASFDSRDYQAVRFPGWFTGNAGDYAGILILNNDFYIATGDNAYAMILITDSPTIAGSTVAYQMIQDSWSATEIKFTPENFNDLGANMHVHIFKADETIIQNVPFTRGAV